MGKFFGLLAAVALAGAVIAFALLGGREDRTDASPHSRAGRHGAAAPARLGTDWRSATDRPVSSWTFTDAAAPAAAASFDRIAAAIDANMLPPRDSVRIGDLINRLSSPAARTRTQTGPSGEPVLAKIATVLTTTPWNDDTVLLWVAVSGAVENGRPRVEIAFNPKTVASWRPLGDPESLPQAESGAINAAMMYEVSPRSEVAADPSARYGAVRYWADRSGSTAIGDAGGRTNDAPLIAADMIVPIDNTPADARFAAALAGFGGLLRGDPAMRDLSCTDVIQLAKTAAEPDPDGARAEFISLMERAEPLIDLPPRETGPAAAGSADDSAH